MSIFKRAYKGFVTHPDRCKALSVTVIDVLLPMAITHIGLASCVTKEVFMVAQMGQKKTLPIFESQIILRCSRCALLILLLYYLQLKLFVL